MNREAFSAITLAQVQYLEANGWQRGREEGTWTEPQCLGRRGRTLEFGHAVNSQLYHDRNWVKIAPADTPPSLMQRLEWQYGEIRREWPQRHEPGYRTSSRRRRQDIRGRIRTIARLQAEGGVALTRVEKCRLERAMHAKHHRETGCPCGKEGPPY